MCKDIFELSSVSVGQWNDQIDANISKSHASMSHGYNESNNEDCMFAEALSVQGEISKLCALIGSCNISDDNAPCSLFDRPTTATIADLENMLASMIEPDKMEKVQTIVSAMSAGTPKGPSAATLSKLWLISEPLAEKALEQNTQLC